jgi:hypothetical protein
MSLRHKIQSHIRIRGGMGKRELRIWHGAERIGDVLIAQCMEGEERVKMIVVWENSPHFVGPHAQLYSAHDPKNKNKSVLY